MRVLFATAAFLLLSAGCLDSARSPDEEETAAEPIGPVPPGTYRFDSFARVVTDGTLARLPREILYLPSDVDGIDIEVTLWRPDTEEPVPVLVDAGPYYDPAGMVPSFSAHGWATESGHVLRLLENFLPHGYAVAAVSVRGTAGSGGCMDLMGPLEVADLDQAITWLGTQPWSTGNVAMLGKSYDGSTPWQVAGTGNPHLKTIVPMSGVPDIYELMFRNGTTEIRGPFLLNALYYSFALRQPTTAAGDTGEAQARIRRTAEGVACTDHAEGMLAPMYSAVDGGRDPFGFWAARNLKPGVEANYRGSILHVQGLQDWNVDPGLNLPWVDDLNKSGLRVHQMLGQWGHSYPDDANSGPNARWDWAELLLRWFDRELKGLDVAVGPAVQVLDTTGRWRVEEHWPPRDATWTTYHLATPGELAESPGQAASIPLAPVPVAEAGQVPLPGASASFDLPARDTDLLVVGLPKVHITVTPHGPGGSVAGWLYTVAPDGMETKVGTSMINLRFADGTQEPKDVVPGQPLLLRMEIQPMDAVVPAGHALRLRVWEYREDQGSPTGPDVQGRLPGLPTAMMLEVGGSSHSVLELPTVSRPAAAYFTPPQAP